MEKPTERHRLVTRIHLAWNCVSVEGTNTPNLDAWVTMDVWRDTCDAITQAIDDIHFVVRDTVKLETQA